MHEIETGPITWIVQIYAQNYKKIDCCLWVMLQAGFKEIKVQSVGISKLPEVQMIYQLCIKIGLIV